MTLRRVSCNNEEKQPTNQHTQLKAENWCYLCIVNRNQTKPLLLRSVNFI